LLKAIESDVPVGQLSKAAVSKRHPACGRSVREPLLQAIGATPGALPHAAIAVRFHLWTESAIRLYTFWLFSLRCLYYSGVVREITVILNRAGQGDPKAAEQLLPLVYKELRRLASSKMARESGGHTLQATALVHEAWLRLGGDDQPTWQNRAHFFSAAAEAMRRILIDSARRRRARRHGGGLQRVEITKSALELEAPERADDELLAVHESLENLAARSPRKAELVKLRYFGGLTLDQAADALGISLPTAKRDWAFARAWLFEEINRVRRD